MSRCFTVENSPNPQRSVDNPKNALSAALRGVRRVGWRERVRGSPSVAPGRSWGYSPRRCGPVVGRLKRRSQNRIPAPNRTSKSRTCARRNHREPIERSTPTPTCGKIPKRMLAGSSAHGRAPVKSTRNRCMGTGGVSITGWPSARQARLARCANRIPRSRCGVQRGFLDKRQYAVTPPTCSTWAPPRARSTTISCLPRCS